MIDEEIRREGEAEEMEFGNPSPLDLELKGLAARYLDWCNEYDLGACTLRDDRGAPVPADDRERAFCTWNAEEADKVIGEWAKDAGATRKKWRRAVADEAERRRAR